MYTGATFDSSGQFYSPQYESSTYLGGWSGWGDQKVIGCLTETTTCVVAKPLLVLYGKISLKIRILKMRKINATNSPSYVDK